MISLVYGNSSAQAQGFCPSSPDPFPSLMLGSGNKTTTHTCTAGYSSVSHDNHCKLHGMNVIGVSESETSPRKCLMYKTLSLVEGRVWGRHYRPYLESVLTLIGRHL